MSDLSHSSLGADPMKPLTPRQKEVLELVMDFITEVGRPPALRELMQLIDVGTAEGARGHVNLLVKKGYIGRRRGGRISVLRNPTGRQVRLAWLTD